MKKIFLNLIDKLKELKKFKNVYIYNNNVDRLRTGLINFDNPSCFIEIKVISDECLTFNFEGLTLDVRFHIVDIDLDGLNNTYDRNYQTFYYRDILNKLNVDYSLPFCSPFQLKKDIQSFKHGNIYHYTMVYKTYFIDNSAYNEPFYLFPQPVFWDTANFLWNECELTWDDLFFPTFTNNIMI